MMVLLGRWTRKEPWRWCLLARVTSVARITKMNSGEHMEQGLLESEPLCIAK